jgi:hypothetical protein
MGLVFGKVAAYLRLPMREMMERAALRRRVASCANPVRVVSADTRGTWLAGGSVVSGISLNRGKKSVIASIGL